MLEPWSERVGKRSVSTRVLNLRLSFLKYIHGNLIMVRRLHVHKRTCT